MLWFVHPDYWNRGYATEMARDAVRAAFDVLYERDVEHIGIPHVLYRLTPGR